MVFQFKTHETSLQGNEWDFKLVSVRCDHRELVLLPSANDLELV